MYHPRKVLTFRVSYASKCSLSGVKSLESTHFPCIIPWKMSTFRGICSLRRVSWNFLETKLWQNFGIFADFSPHSLVWLSEDHSLKSGKGQSCKNSQTVKCNISMTPVKCSISDHLPNGNTPGSWFPIRISLENSGKSQNHCRSPSRKTRIYISCWMKTHPRWKIWWDCPLSDMCIRNNSWPEVWCLIMFLQSWILRLTFC